MSALPLKADMFSVRNDVRLVPKADIAMGFQRLVAVASHHPCLDLLPRKG
jgi:hypothetical protein